jgi:HTH-type transcriptional regulator/antitoxin HigA
MDQRGLTQEHLSKELGGQSVVSAILNGKREINVRQAKALATRFNVPASLFV